MSLFNWSDTGLPNPTQDLAAKAETSVIRTKMDSGRIRQRRRFTSALRTINVSWVFTDDEFQLFQGVFLYYLSSGADKFIMSLPLGGGFQDYTVNFIGDGYSEAWQQTNFWKISAQLEVENISPLSEAETAAALP